VTVHALLQRRETTVGSLLVLAALSSACFGAAVGGYTGHLQILYAAIKMPIYFLGTLGLSFTAMHIFAARDLRAGETFGVALETVALTTVVLAALAPIEALMSVSCPKPSRRAYSFLVLLLTGCVGAAGVCGVVRAYRRLGSVRLTAAWVLIYQFVGTQMAWLLRPWVNDGLSGNRFLPLRDNLHGNFYEAVHHAFVELWK
jgi:hypothetical protein